MCERSAESNGRWLDAQWRQQQEEAKKRRQGGALLGMASGFSQLIRGGLKLNRQLEAATRRSREAGSAGATPRSSDAPKSSEDQ